MPLQRKTLPLMLILLLTLEPRRASAAF